jgi:YidC/Oxa1 family membrane protein insertase
MLFTVLTQQSGILGPFAWILGKILEGLYTCFAYVGIENIGICIIVFTLVVKLLMFPLTFKQQKFSKMSSVMNPEIQAIQAKYKDRKDQESVMKMNEETKLVYEKYGTSPTGGCLQLIIQMPIIFALYRVIMNIPAYVPQVKIFYTNIISKIGYEKIIADSNFISVADAKNISLSGISDLSSTEATNKVVDVLSKYTSSDWKSLQESFSGASSVITDNVNNIDRINHFFGINLSQSPSTLVHAGVMIAILIPILSALTQFISSKLTMASSNSQTDESSPMAASMKSMTLTMPLVSAFMCYSLATGIGVYWIMSAVCQIFQQLFVNWYFKRVPVEVLIEKNKEKAKKKRARMGINDEMIKNASNYNTKKISTINSKANINVNTNKVETNSNPKAGSLAAKANMVKDYNEKNK